MSDTITEQGVKLSELPSWELDPTARNGDRDPTDIALRLELYSRYAARVALCAQCTHREADPEYCARDIDPTLPDEKAPLMLMNLCANDLETGSHRPGHGSRSIALVPNPQRAYYIADPVPLDT